MSVELLAAGVRKDCVRRELHLEPIGRWLRECGAPPHLGDPVKAVGWVGDYGDGPFRLVIADYANGQRAQVNFPAGVRRLILTRIPCNRRNMK